jgi:hypothetical protein
MMLLPTPLLQDFSTTQPHPRSLSALGGVHIGADRLAHCLLSRFMKHPG